MKLLQFAGRRHRQRTTPGPSGYGPDAAIPAVFNAHGPWQWQLRESDFYGDYLNCRPKQHVRLRVHEYPSEGHVKFVALHGTGFKALLEIEAEGGTSRSEIDDIFRRLL